MFNGPYDNYTRAHDAVLRHAGLMKTAARREIKILQDLLSKGRYEEAARMGKNLHIRGEGVAGYTPREHIKQLGGGSEGVADLITSKEHGLEVLKQYNPYSRIMDDGLLDQKIHALEQLNNINHPDIAFAKFYGEGPRRGSAKLRTTRHEYVPGQALSEEGHRGNLWQNWNYANRQIAHDMAQDSNLLEVAHPLSFRRGLIDKHLSMAEEPHIPLQQAVNDVSRWIRSPSDPNASMYLADAVAGHGGNTVRSAITGKPTVIDFIALNDGSQIDGEFFRSAMNLPGLRHRIMRGDLSPNPGVLPVRDLSNPVVHASSNDLKRWMYTGVEPYAKQPRVQRAAKRTVVPTAQGTPPVSQQTPIVSQQTQVNTRRQTPTHSMPTAPTPYP